MKILYADYDTPENHAIKEVKSASSSNSKTRRWWDVLIEQCINAAIVGGICAFSASWVDPWVGLKAFGLTFLIEMRKYRRL